MVTYNLFCSSHQKCIQTALRRALFILLFITACTTAERTIPLLAGTIPIHAPSTASAGSTFEVSVGPIDVANGTPVGLVIVGVHGPKVYNTVFTNGEAHFSIPSTDTYQPGYMALIVASENARGETSIIVFSPKKQSA